MLIHQIFESAAAENAFWASHPSAHLVKVIVVGSQCHVWYAESRGPYNGQHLIRGGVDGDGTTYENNQR